MYTKKPKGNGWMDDGDDAHFVPIKKHSKKKISSLPKGHPAVKVTKKKKSVKKSTVKK